MFEYERELEKELRESARFIREALDEKPAYIEMASSDEEGEPLRIDKDLSESSFTSLDEEEVFPLEKPPKIAAIDGGSATIVNGHSFTVDTYRTGYLIFQNTTLVKEYIESPAIITVSLGNLKDIFVPIYHNLVGTSPEELPHFDRAIDRIRTLKEWSLAESLIDELEEGDLILVDGSLRSSVSLPYIMLERIAKKAVKKGIRLIGVTKASTLYWGERSPLIPIIHRLGERAYANQNWFCLVSNPKNQPAADTRWFGQIYVAKLSPKSDFAFRVDINRFDEERPATIMAALAAASQDPAYMGYPYPLAAIHNRVRIEPSMIEDFYYRLQSLALEEGVDIRDWETLFAHFHELLDVSD